MTKKNIFVPKENLVQTDVNNDTDTESIDVVALHFLPSDESDLNEDKTILGSHSDEGKGTSRDIDIFDAMDKDNSIDDLPNINTSKEANEAIVLPNVDIFMNPTSEAIAVNSIEIKVEETENELIEVDHYDSSITSTNQQHQDYIKDNQSNYAKDNQLDYVKDNQTPWSQFLEKTDKMFQCGICKERIVGAKAFKRHIDSHRELSFDDGNCVVERKAYTPSSSINIHSSHKDVFFGTTTFVRKLDSHQETFSEGGGNLSGQKQCSNSTPRKRSLYSCSFCDKQFISPADIVRHTRVHTGERPFQCDVCFKSFKIKHHLRSHMKTHMKKGIVLHDHSSGI